MNRIYKMLLSKLAWVVLGFAIFYMVGIGLGIVPQYMKDMVSWGAENFGILVFFACFMVSAYIVLQFVNRKKRSDHE